MEPPMKRTKKPARIFRVILSPLFITSVGELEKFILARKGNYS